MESIDPTQKKIEYTFNKGKWTRQLDPCYTLVSDLKHGDTTLETRRST